ncbi:MAG: pyruvate kinase [Phycisphaerae bacterium]
MSYVSEYVDADLVRPKDLFATLIDLRRQVDTEGRRLYESWAPRIRRPFFHYSAWNLAQYLAMRSRDWRRIQEALVPWGLSSLGRTESRVLPSLDVVLHALGALCGANRSTLPPRPTLREFFLGHRLLRHQTDAVFGRPPDHRWARIMVTMPTEAAENASFSPDLMRAGMDAIRITCAHDSRAEWQSMIRSTRVAAARMQRRCRVFMDLSGPKIRTGELVGSKSGKRLFDGDRFLLSRCPQHKSDLPQVTLSLPEILDQIKVGADVWIDDGQWCATVEALAREGAILRVTQTPPKGARLRSEKGLNFPDQVLKLASLTSKDLDDLDFALQHADGVCYSFVNEPADVDAFLQAVASRRRVGKRPVIVLKIETQRAVRNLPALLVRSASIHPTAIMIARGDLAVEIGFERLAEMQEEILWLCEAAHVPVIWATQVLERFVKKGTPSRPEMTDAAMSERAECVMLNKGPFIRQGVETLDRLLTQMQRHTTKKTPKMHALRSWVEMVR